MGNSFASTSLAATIGLLKNWYAGPVVSQFNDELPWYKQIDKGSEKFSGLAVVRAVKVRRNQGVGATSDGGILPTIGTQTTVNATISAKFNYLRFGLTGPMLKSAQTDKGAFASIMDFEMREGMNDLKTDVNRQFFGDGTGIVGLLAAAVAASQTLSVYGRDSTEEGSKYIDVGAVLDLVSAAGVLLSSGLVVQSVTGTSGAVTVVVSSPVTAAASDILVRSQSYNQEIQGLAYVLPSAASTIFGINQSTYGAFRGTYTDNGAGALSLNAMQTAYNEARRLGGANINYVVSDFDSERFYNRLLIADKRYSSTGAGKVMGDGTFSDKSKSYLEWAGVPFVPDKDATKKVYFIDSSAWKKYVLSELEWADETGSYMIAQTSSDAFEVRLRLFCNIFCEKPRSQAVLANYIAP